MNEEEKILETSKRIGYKVGTYCNDEEIEVFEKFLEDYKNKSNLIEKQKAEIEKKNKIIDLMLDEMAFNHNINSIVDVLTIKKQLKEKFENKVKESK